ncbi:MAG TPA: hypothetical protein VFR31_01795 [Thermoanaerobaculia bacterium]|nr:hypothetical protein [Thermoanaerobaculia bacterium]
MTRKHAILMAGLALVLAASPATADRISITAVQAFPNERMWDDPPQHAIDGNAGTFTWTTPAYNTAYSYLAIGFPKTRVSRIRLWKTPDGGGGENYKNLVIEYTADTTSPLSARSWRRVSGLQNGFNGQEVMRADSVNADGSVTGDRHDSVSTQGWASLSFNAVEATGLRIGFSSPGLVHYRVGEFQAHFDAGGFAPPPPADLPLSLHQAEAFPNGRYSNDLPPNAIDGNPATFTWTTQAYNTVSPSYLAVGFARTSVSRIRLWKTPEGGGGENYKNLVIEYTADTSGPLSARNWTRVSGLRNGFNGQEMMQADSINAYGYVTNDRHDSVSSQKWASLTFDPVEATGLRIGFSSPGLVHYRVGELQVFAVPGAASALTESEAERPSVNGAVLTAAWFPEVTARKYCEIEHQSRLLAYQISDVPIPPGTTVTRANMYSADDWGRTFNGMLVPAEDRYYASILCSASTARKGDLDIDTRPRQVSENPGVFIEVFPFSARLELREEYAGEHKNGVYTRPILTLSGLTPLRPSIPVIFYEEPAIPELGFKHAKFAADIAPELEHIRPFLTSPRHGPRTVDFRWNARLRQETFPVLCSYQGFANRNDVNIVLSLVCKRNDPGLPRDQQEISQHVPWHEFFPEKTFRLMTVPALAEYLTNPYTGPQVTIDYRLHAVLRNDGVVPRSSIHLELEGAGAYAPEIVWRDGFGIESIRLKSTGTGLAGIDTSSGTMEGVRFTTQGALIHADIEAALQKLDTLATVIAVADKAYLFYNKGGFVNFTEGTNAVLSSMFLHDAAAGWSVANFNPVSIVVFVATKVIMHNLNIIVRDGFERMRDRIKDDAIVLADRLARSVAMARYYGEIYPYRRELFTLQFWVAAAGGKLGDRAGDPYFCESMVCQNLTNGAKLTVLAVLPPVHKSNELRNLWRIQENGVWREICRNNCPVQ